MTVRRSRDGVNSSGLGRGGGVMRETLAEPSVGTGLAVTAGTATSGAAAARWQRPKAAGRGGFTRGSARGGVEQPTRGSERRRRDDRRKVHLDPHE